MEMYCHGLELAIQLGRPDEEGWMSASVKVRVPSMNSKFTCTIELMEWRGFVQVLERLQSSIGHSCTETWGNMEENIEITFVLSERGALSGTYKFSPTNFSLGPVLSGAFEADQTFLQTWAAQAAEVVA